MNDAERYEHLAYFQSFILPWGMVDLHGQIDDLKEKDIDAFSGAAVKIVERLVATAVIEFDLPKDVRKIEKRFLSELHCVTVRGLNYVLPLDYPYVFIVIEIGKTKKLEVGVSKRRSIPGWRDWISPGNVPVFWTESYETFNNQKGSYYRTTIFPDAEDPPEPESETKT